MWIILVQIVRQKITSCFAGFAEQSQSEWNDIEKVRTLKIANNKASVTR